MNNLYFPDLTYPFPQKPPSHRRQDTGVWPCTLDGCTKVFAREADLKRHQRTTKGHSIPGSGVGSPCPLCDATFTRSDAMRRHLKSRHNGKTPETLTLPDHIPGSSTTRGRRRACSPSNTELSESDGEHHGDDGYHRSQSMARSRAASAASPYYVPPQTQLHHHQQQNHLSPAILYQAAMSYEIRHALSPISPRQNHSQNEVQNQAQHPPRRDVYSQPPPHPGYQEFPADDYTSYPQSDQQQEQPRQQQFTAYSHDHYNHNHNSNAESVYYTSPPRSPVGYEAWGGKDDSGISRQNQQHGGLAALAMHAARVRPMSPLGNKSKTKSELESALGPSSSTSYTR